MPIITVTVENPDELLNAAYFGAGALGRVERSAVGGGIGYAEIATFGIIAATRLYTVYDLTGAYDSWYRVRYSKSDASNPSQYGPEFQTGDETAGLICSVYDVEQELGNPLTANDKEVVVEKIRQVTVAIEGYCARWFIPRPVSGTATYRVGTSRLQRLRFSKGIRSLTSLGIAASNQPATGGTYTLANAADYWLDPPEMDRDAGWPATGIMLNSTSALRFVSATFGAEVTGSFGWASVPYDIQGVATRAVVRRYIGKGGGGVSVAVGPSGTEFLLPDMSGADRETLNRYAARSF